MKNSTPSKRILDALSERVCDVILYAASECRTPKNKKGADPSTLFGLMETGRRLGIRITHRYSPIPAPKNDWAAKFLYRGTAREVIAYRPLTSRYLVHPAMLACIGEYILETDSTMQRILSKSGAPEANAAAFHDHLHSFTFRLKQEAEYTPEPETRQGYAQAA